MVDRGPRWLFLAGAILTAIFIARFGWLEASLGNGAFLVGALGLGMMGYCIRPHLGLVLGLVASALAWAIASPLKVPEPLPETQQEAFLWLWTALTAAVPAATGWIRGRIEAMASQSRALAFLASIGELATVSNQERELLEGTVRAAVDKGGYALAMIWTSDELGPEPSAWAVKQGHLTFQRRDGVWRLEFTNGRNRIQAELIQELREKTLAARALRSGRLVESGRSANNGDPIVALARTLGARALAAAPIRVRHQAFGTLVVAAEDPLAFRGEAAVPLEEAARTLGQALERLWLEDELMLLHLTDPLTGILNRRGFENRGRAMLAHAREREEKAALVFVDLDRFKEVNDTMGHHAGDEVLRQAALRLLSATRTRDLVARVGGDEFALLLLLEDPGVLGRITARLYQALARPYNVGERTFSLDASMGVALFPEDGATLEELLRKGDIAMYQAKESRRRIAFFDAESDLALKRRLELEAELRRAIDEKAIELDYQPVVAPPERLVFLETLARWKVPPSVFIPLAEEIGLAWPLDRLVLEKAIEQIVEWRKAGLSARVSVNLSPRSFEEPELLSFLEGALATAKIPPGGLVLELTERAIFSTDRTVLFEKLKTTGVQLALDDFGTGYSSLILVKDLPLDFIKLPREFVRDLPESERDAAIADTVHRLAHRLKMGLVAEGVERREQIESLKTIGYRLFQGHYFAKPLPPHKAARWLSGERPTY